MTECYPNRIRLQPVQRRQVEAQFCGGDITGNGGIALLAAVDRKLGLTQELARGLSDTRRKAKCARSALYLRWIPAPVPARGKLCAGMAAPRVFVCGFVALRHPILCSLTA